MKARFASALILGALTICCESQSPPANVAGSMSIACPELDQQFAELAGQLAVDGAAYAYDKFLSDDIGARVTGTKSYATAAEWTVKEFTRMGINNVHTEPWIIDNSWEPTHQGVARLLSPRSQPLHLISDGWSPSTPPGGVRGSIYYLQSFTKDTVMKDASSINGTIVLADRSSLSGKGPLLYGALLDAVQALRDVGARGLILGIGASGNGPSMAGLTRYGSVAPLPVATLGLEDSLLIKRLLGENHGPVEVEYEFENLVKQQVPVVNVVAELPGRDPHSGYVLIGAHLDPWSLGTGAEDNGTGVATVLAIARAISKLHLHPKRAIRFVLFGGQEQGLLGSLAYIRQHDSELSECSGVFITDSGSGAPTGWDTLGREDEVLSLFALKPLLDQFGAGAVSNDGSHIFSTDDAAFVVRGVPTFTLINDTTDYHLLHHKAGDTFDKVNQRDLMLGVAVVGVTTYWYAEEDESLRRLPDVEVQEQLRQSGGYEVYQDMMLHNLLR